MSFLNAVLRGLFDLLMMPFRGVGPWVSLVPVSLLTAIVALLVYRRFSNQDALAAVKAKIAASFFEIRLFNDDLRAILRAQWDLLRNNAVYMGLNLKPMAVMLVPMLILMTQLQFHYGYGGLKVGEPSVLTVTFAEPASGNGASASERPRIELRAPEEIVIERGPVWIPEKRELAWRLNPQHEGRFEIELVAEAGSVSLPSIEAPLSKTVVVSDRIVRRSPERLRASFLNQLLFPAEDPIDKAIGIESIRLAYPEANVDILGIELHWIIWWLVLSIVFAFLLRSRFGVTF